ncbi:MAG: hypothetical protein ACRCWQ_04445 [Bacilli bacterium]
MIKAFRRKTEAIYAFRMIDLLRKPFKEWEAFELGIIDDDGEVIKRPVTNKEKSKWSRFHTMTASVKKMLDRGPKRKSELNSLWLSYRTLREEYLREEDLSTIESEFPMLVEMVSGDAGGNPDNIAAGKNSGAVVYPGPGGPKKKKVKKMTEMVDFKQFVESLEADKAEALRLAEEEKNKVVEPTSFSLKAIGANSVVVEAVGSDVTSVVLSGKTTHNSVTEAEIKEAFKELGQEGVLAYVKEATKLIWKTC